MKGEYRVFVQNRRVRYDFVIHRNITVIKGDSATGKTTLVNMIQEYQNGGADSGVSLVCAVPCVVLVGRNWKDQLSLYHNSIIFIDEGNSFTKSIEFAREVQASDNYFVIVSRESLSALPYSVKEIYGIRESDGDATAGTVHNEFYLIE